MGSVAQGVDEKVSKACFGIADRTEGRGDAELLAEGEPVPEGGGLRGSVFGGIGLGGDVESKPEISLEQSSLNAKRQKDKHSEIDRGENRLTGMSVW